MYGKKQSAQEAPIYGPFELSLFAEETILNARLLSNGKSNARKSAFRANVQMPAVVWFLLEFRAFDWLA